MKLPTELEKALINALYEAQPYIPRGTVAHPIVEAAIAAYEERFPPPEDGDR